MCIVGLRIPLFTRGRSTTAWERVLEFSPLSQVSYHYNLAEERKRLCSFVVVGGGPTGVEFAAELHDFITQDIKRMYPSLIPHIAIKLIEGREILSSFDVELREWAKRRLQVEGVEIVTGECFQSLSESPWTLRMFDRLCHRLSISIRVHGYLCWSSITVRAWACVLRVCS